MNRRDWLCGACGDAMIKTSAKYMACPGGHGSLRPLWYVSNLPRATRIDYKRFVINFGASIVRGTTPYWEYVPHAHERCLGHAPEPNHVVAAIKLAHGMMPARIRPMTFRPSKPPRNKV